MDDNNEPQAPPDNDRTPTQQDETSGRAAGWTMPEPVFRRSSGYLPKGFEQRVRESQGQAVAPAQETVAAAPDFAAEDVSAEVSAPPALDAPAEAQMDAAIAPQPDVDALAEQPAATVEITPPVRKKRSVFGVILMVLGLIIAFGVIAAVVAAAVIWYFYPGIEPQGLN
jgi:hypothetical protein